MRVIIYCRISKHNPEEKSLDAQENIIRKYVEANKWQVRYVCRETHVAYNHTPARLKSIIKNEHRSTIVIKCVDRFCRKVSKAKKMIRKVLENKIQIYFVQEKILLRDRDSARKVLKYVRDAEREIKKMVQRRADIREDKIDQGIHTGGRVPYGYAIKRTHIGKQLIENEYEQSIIRFIRFLRRDINKSLDEVNDKLKKIVFEASDIEVFDEYGNKEEKLKGYMSFPQIADLLNEYRITKRGELWTARKFQRNPRMPISI